MAPPADSWKSQLQESRVCGNSQFRAPPRRRTPALDCGIDTDRYVVICAVSFPNFGHRRIGAHLPFNDACR